MNNEIKAEITAIYEFPKDEISFGISAQHETWFVDLIKEETSVSLTDFINANKTYYTSESGTEMIQYKWKLSDLPEEKINDLESFAKFIFQIFHNKKHGN